MIVPRGAKWFPNQSPLLGMTIPTVEGNLRLGYSPRRRAGVGLLLPIDPTVPVPGTSSLARKPAVRGVGVSRGMGRARGMGAARNYCRSNPPDAATVAILAARGDTVNLIDCNSGATNETGVAPPGTFVPGQIGTQPVQVLPAQPVYEDCNPGVLGPAGSTACAARNLAAQTAWQNAHGQAAADYNRRMCIWNGQQNGYDVTAFCNTVYPPGYAGSGSPATPADLARLVGPPVAAPSYSPTVKFQTARATPQVGDGWSVLITGGAPNSPVTVSVNGGASQNYGNTDASGNFTTSGTFTADQVGKYTEQWSVGGQSAGAFSFTVSAAPGSSAPAGGSQPASAGSSSSGAAASATAVTLGGFDLSAIPVWGWIAAAGVGFLLLGGKH